MAKRIWRHSVFVNCKLASCNIRFRIKPSKIRPDGNYHSLKCWYADRDKVKAAAQKGIQKKLAGDKERLAKKLATMTVEQAFKYGKNLGYQNRIHYERKWGMR